MASIKSATGLVGLNVVPNAREVLVGVLKRTLYDLKEVPVASSYRTNVQKITSHRLGIAEAAVDDVEIETKIGVGQIEEVLEMAERELALLHRMKEFEPWKGAAPKLPPGHAKWF